MGRINSSRKGAEFERWVCQRLSQWADPTQKDELFWRTAGSGARATTALTKGKVLGAQQGDVGALSARGACLTDLFLIECKHVRRLGVSRVLGFGSGQPLAGFLQKVQMQANAAKKYPLLIAKGERAVGTLIVLPAWDFVWGIRSKFFPMLHFYSTGMQFVACPLDRFLSSMVFDELIQQVRGLRHG